MPLSPSFQIESKFILITIVLLFAAVLTMVSILHDVLLHQDNETRAALSLSEHFRLDRAKGRFRRAQAIRDSWDRHVQLFPTSRKRVLFGALFLSGILTVFALPFWLAMTGR